MHKNDFFIELNIGNCSVFFFTTYKVYERVNSCVICSNNLSEFLIIVDHFLFVFRGRFSSDILASNWPNNTAHIIVLLRGNLLTLSNNNLVARLAKVLLVVHLEVLASLLPLARYAHVVVI